jgi:tetratricopeptide (TPR) repeat protein
MNEQILALENEADQLRSEEKYDDAVAKLKEALEIDENFARGHLGLSVLYHHLNDYEKSCYHGERVCEIEPNDAFNWSALSVTFQRAFEGTRDPMYIQKAEEAMARSRAGG